MALVEVEGIVLGETPYSESSKVLNVLTKDYGKIGILSKGCRQLKSPLRSVSARFTYGIFHIYYKKEGLSTLSAVDVLDAFLHLLADIEKISYATYLADLTDQVQKQSSAEEEALGVRPNIDSCALCGSTKNIATISPDVGGYVCQNCYQHEKIYSDKMIKLVRLFFYVDLAKITSLKVSTSVQKEIEEFIDLYYDQYTGLYLKSKQFLNNLKKLGVGDGK